ncbi:MAG TPA: hypothetical protein VLR92_04945 [Blastocatellia bacterium]|nr:hypothetical protein [Blastocatellia bacterium]
MQNKLSILIALANHPDGQAKLDEFDDRVGGLIAAADEQIESSERFSAIAHIDVFQSGLVALEGDSLQITKNGWLLLRTLGIVPQETPDPDYASNLQLFNLIGDLIGPDARLKIFDPPTQSIDKTADLIPLHETTDLEAPFPGFQETEPLEPIGSSDRRAHVDPPAAVSNETSATRDDAEAAVNAPAFLTRKFASGASPRTSLLSRLKMRMRQGKNIWRHHLQQDQSPKVTSRPGVNLERGLLALLSLLAIVTAAGAFTAVMQVRSLKSELAPLQRELLSLRERVARLDQIERNKEPKDKPSDQKIQSSREGRPEDAPLLLSREEIQLIRDYIKPAPVAGSAAAPISVGDRVPAPTIPIPSPVTEKVPKLLGARFAIKNGAIIIVRKDSRQADAVIGPN